MSDADELRFPERGPGTCINCGFLGKWYVVDDAVRSAALDERTTGDFWVATDAQGRQKQLAKPQCYVGAFNLRGEVEIPAEPSGDGASPHARTMEVIERNRSCEKFTPWRQYLSIREHWDQAERSRAEKAVRSFEHRWNKRFLWVAVVAVAATLLVWAIPSPFEQSQVTVNVGAGRPTTQAATASPAPSP